MAEAWEKRLKAQAKHAKKLVGVLVGRDPASVLYLKLKGKIAKRLGIEFELMKFPASVTRTQLRRAIDKLNADPVVGGIIVQLPLPKGLSNDEVVNWVAVEKDVDGLSDGAILEGKVLPATAWGVVELMRSYKVSVKNKKIVLLGFSRLLNVPLSIYLASQGAEVIVLQSDTKQRRELKTADIVISAVGKAKLIRAGDVKKGVVIIDAGIVKQGKKIVGDVNFVEVSKKASAITPVPGGVGPMTLVALMANLINLGKSAPDNRII